MTDTISPCPKCGYKIEHSSPIEKKDAGASASKGDFTLCLSCGEILRFDDNMQLKISTQKDLEDLEIEQYKKITKGSLLIKHFKPLQNKNYGK